MTDIVGNRTLSSQWDETVRFYAERTFLTYVSASDTDASYTYAAFDALVRRAANYFLELGVQKGQLVALHMHNMPSYLVCWLALAKIGAVSVPLNAYYQLDECSYIIEKCDIRVIVAEAASVGMFAENRDKLKLEVVVVSEGRSALTDVLSLEDGMARQATSLTEERTVRSEDIAVILFTSGTTRHPKGAVYTHCCVLYGGFVHTAQMGMESGDRFLSSMPCYHMDFQEMAVMPVICTGSTLVMVEHFSARRFWRQICQYKAQFTDTMSMMNRTLMLQPEEDWEKAHCLKQIYFSMGLSDEEKERFEARFRVSLLNSYGMTETVSGVTCAPLTGDKNWPSVGRPALSYEIKIVDENGVELPDGETGEICVHGVPGRSIVLGYYREPEASARLIDADGWLHSGDRGYLSDGWLFFVGRCSERIKRSGENVSSLEVECVLTSHALVADAAVVGVPDPLRNQAVKAFVLPVEGAALTKEELTRYCEARLAKFKVPSEIEFVDDFPRTSTGKIKKHLLVQ